MIEHTEPYDPACSCRVCSEYAAMLEEEYWRQVRIHQEAEAFYAQMQAELGQK